MWLMQLFSMFPFFFLLHFTGKIAYPKPLSKEEEQVCFRRLRGSDPKMAKEAKDKLVLHNLRLVAHVVKKYDIHTESKEDLLSIGTIGLLKAVDRFLPDKKVRFSTYAAKCIENEILMKFRSNKKWDRDVSLQELTEEEPDGGRTLFSDGISAPDDLEEQVENSWLQEKLHTEMADLLDEREQKVLCLRYGIFPEETEHTQWQTAQKLGISRSYVSRIEKNAIRKLKNAFSGKGK